MFCACETKILWLYEILIGLGCQQESELPWLAPKKGFKFNLSSLTNVIKDSAAANADSSLVPTTLGVAAAAGVGLVVFSEAETALQLLGSAALVQFFVKKFLFADDRQKTLKEIQTFLDTKIAPKEIIDELKATENGPAILEETLSTDSLTPSKEPATASGASAAFKGDEPLALEAPGPLEEFNLTSMEGYTASARPTDLPQSTTPLSPYTQVTEY
jgi:chitinase domain-containing protein 1